MQNAEILFSHSKTGHFAEILTTGLFGQMVSNSLIPPDPSQIELYGHLVIQILVAVVTIWATVRKALQKPEAVVKVPAAVSDASAVPTAGDGDAQ